MNLVRPCMVFPPCGVELLGRHLLACQERVAEVSKEVTLIEQSVLFESPHIGVCVIERQGVGPLGVGLGPDVSLVYDSDEFENQTRAETPLIKDQRRRERREEGKERKGGERAAFCGILDRI